MKVLAIAVALIDLMLATIELAAHPKIGSVYFYFVIMLANAAICLAFVKGSFSRRKVTN